MAAIEKLSGVVCCPPEKEAKNPEGGIDTERGAEIRKRAAEGLYLGRWLYETFMAGHWDNVSDPGVANWRRLGAAVRGALALAEKGASGYWKERADKLSAAVDCANSEAAYWKNKAIELRSAPGSVPDRSIVGEIRAERARQRSKWTAAHDDGHRDGALAYMAAELAVEHTDVDLDCDRSSHDPRGQQDRDAWGLIEKNPDPRRRLVIAAALLVAEIERLDRAMARAPRPEGGKTYPVGTVELANALAECYDGHIIGQEPEIRALDHKRKGDRWLAVARSVQATGAYSAEHLRGVFVSGMERAPERSWGNLGVRPRAPWEAVAELARRWIEDGPIIVPPGAFDEPDPIPEDPEVQVRTVADVVAGGGVTIADLEERLRQSNLGRPTRADLDRELGALKQAIGSMISAAEDRMAHLVADLAKPAPDPTPVLETSRKVVDTGLATVENVVMTEAEKLHGHLNGESAAIQGMVERMETHLHNRVEGVRAHQIEAWKQAMEAVDRLRADIEKLWDKAAHSEEFSALTEEDLRMIEHAIEQSYSRALNTDVKAIVERLMEKLGATDSERRGVLVRVVR